MRKWGLFLAFGLSLILWSSVLIIPSSYLAQSSFSGHLGSKVGVLSVNELRLKKVEGLKDELKHCMLEEGKEPEYTVLNADNDLDKLPELAESLVHQEPDVLVAAGAPETRALQAATEKADKKIPIVFMGTLSPAKIGLVDDVLKPSGNVTGLDNYHFELTPKRLELLHLLLPKVRRIGVLGDSRINFFDVAPQTLDRVAQEYSLDLFMYSVTEWDQVENVFQSMKLNQVEAVLLLPGFFLETTGTKLMDDAKRDGLPLFGVYPDDAEKGCLASYGTSYYSQGTQSAHLVHKILMGCTVGELPVETPDEVQFVVNLESAKELGVEMELTQNVLSLADRIIR